MSHALKNEELRKAAINLTHSSKLGFFKTSVFLPLPYPTPLPVNFCQIPPDFSFHQ